MGMPFIELSFDNKFVLRFVRNPDGTYGHWDKASLLELQPLIDLAFEKQEKENETTNPTQAAAS